MSILLPSSFAFHIGQTSMICHHYYLFILIKVIIFSTYNYALSYSSSSLPPTIFSPSFSLVQIVSNGMSANTWIYTNIILVWLVNNLEIGWRFWKLGYRYIPVYYLTRWRNWWIYYSFSKVGWSGEGDQWFCVITGYPLD